MLLSPWPCFPYAKVSSSVCVSVCVLVFITLLGTFIVGVNTLYKDKTPFFLW